MRREKETVHHKGRVSGWRAATEERSSRSILGCNTRLGVGTRTEHYGLKRNWLRTHTSSLSSLKGKRDCSAPSIQVKWKSDESEG